MTKEVRKGGLCMERTKDRKPKSRRNIFSFITRSFLLIALVVGLLVIALPIGTFYFIKNGSTFAEEKSTMLEQIQDLNELATAEAYTKVLIDRQDNAVFGQSIGINLPGTKRQLLVVVPGSIKAGIDLSSLTEEDIVVDEQEKTVQLTLPSAQFLGGAELFFDEVEVFSYEGIFRGKANIEEAYELAEEAKKLILEESTKQGVLNTAEKNAEKILHEVLAYAGYDVVVEFER